MSQPAIARVLVLYPAARDAERTITPVGVSTHGAVDEGGLVTGASMACPGLLTKPVTLRESLSFEGGRASIAWGYAEMANPWDGGRQLWALASWKPLLFLGRRWELYWADAPQGQAPRALSSYALEAAGIIGDMEWSDEDHSVRLVATDRTQIFDKPLDLPRFQGLSECYRFELGRLINVDTTGLTLKGDWTLSGFFRLGPGDLATSGQRLVDWGTTGTQKGALVVLNSGGTRKIRFLGFGLSTQAFDTPDNVLAEDMAWHHFHICRDSAAQTLAIFLDGEELASFGSITGDVDFGTPPEPLSFGAGCTLWAIGWALESGALPADTIKATANQPPDPDGSTIDAYWGAISAVDQSLLTPTGANTGAVVNITAADVVYAGEGWVDAAGVKKPLALGGEIRGVQGFLGDPGRWWSHLGVGPLGGVSEAFHRGLPLDVATQVAEDAELGMVQVLSLIGGDPGSWRFWFDGMQIGGVVEKNAGVLVEHLGVSYLGLSASDFDAATLQAVATREVAYYVPAGSDLSLLQIADDLFAASEAQVYMGRDDRLTAASLTLSGVPSVTLREGPDILWAEDLGILVPTTSQEVWYDRNWDPQSDGDLASTTETDHRSFATTEWREAIWRAVDQVQQDYPEAIEGAPVVSYVTAKSDAWDRGKERQQGAYGADVHRVRLTFARRPVDGSGQLVAGLGALVRVHSTDLDTPEQGRVYRVVEFLSDEGPWGAVECIGAF